MAMTTPRAYGGGYYPHAIPDTPIYDSLVAERGTPQIAPIRVPSSYDTGSHLPALPPARPALPAAPSYQHQQPYQQQPQPQQHTPPHGYQAAAPQPAAPLSYIPQQAAAPRYQQQAPQQPQPQRQPAHNSGFEAMRPVAPRPAQARPAQPQYPDPYAQQQQSYDPRRGY